MYPSEVTRIAYHGFVCWSANDSVDKVLPEKATMGQHVVIEEPQFRNVENLHIIPELLSVNDTDMEVLAEVTIALLPAESCANVI